MANFFRIRNFERFQHYKDRNPPWIRLYGGLWRDRAFFRLPDAVKAHLIGLFALAARLDNRIPDDPEWIAHELCASEPIDLGALLTSGFLVPEHPASGTTAVCKPSDTCSVSESESDSDLLCPKTGRETILDSNNGDLAAAEPCPAPLESKVTGMESAREPERERRRGKGLEVGWPAGFALDEQMRRFAVALGIEPEAEFEDWRDDCAAHDRRYADWRAAWRGRCRNALRFGRRGGMRTRASPAEGAMEVALRRLREASEREQAGDVS
jgi:hypothetical protein